MALISIIISTVIDDSNNGNMRNRSDQNNNTGYPSVRWALFSLSKEVGSLTKVSPVNSALKPLHLLKDLN